MKSKTTATKPPHPPVIIVRTSHGDEDAENRSKKQTTKTASSHDRCDFIPKDFVYNYVYLRRVTICMFFYCFVQ